MAGRPTKYNAERHEAICERLRHGSTRVAAYLSAGVSHDTFANWLERYPAFSEAVTRAEAEAEAACATVIVLAAKDGDWRAAEVWLKRRRRDDWGDSQQVTFLQKVAAEVEKMSDAELLDLLARTGDSDPDSTGDRTAARVGGGNGNGKH